MTGPVPPVDGVRFRPARPDDAPCLAVLGTQVFLDTYATEGIRPALADEVLAFFTVPAMQALLARPDVRVVLAERHGHLVGFAQLHRGAAHACVDARAPVELRRLYVHERFTGRGLGRALLQQAERDAAARGADELWLTAWTGNARALAFYPRCGYRDAGEDVYEFGGDRYDNRVFARRLMPPAALDPHSLPA